MTFTDFLIIYLTFGAPIAVYKYLQTRTADTGRRMLVSGLTFLFWLPAAIRIVSRYLSNAYLSDAFVSRQNSDARARRLFEFREATSTELIRAGRTPRVHEIRETVERYAGLAEAARTANLTVAGTNDLFEAAGRKNPDLGNVCLMRRNLHRLERHHTQARRDFLELFALTPFHAAAGAAVDAGLDLVRELGDEEAFDRLSEWKATKGEVWDSLKQQQAPIATTTSVRPLTMTASLNND